MTDTTFVITHFFSSITTVCCTFINLSASFSISLFLVQCFYIIITSSFFAELLFNIISYFSSILYSYIIFRFSSMILFFILINSSQIICISTNQKISFCSINNFVVFIISFLTFISLLFTFTTTHY